MFPYRPTSTTGPFDDSLSLPSGDMGQMAVSGDPPRGITNPPATYDLSTSPLQHPPLSEISSPSNTTSGTLAPRYQHHTSPTSPPPSSSLSNLDIVAASSSQQGQQHILPSPPAPTGTTSTTNNPFANLLSNADLVIEGSMDDMMKDWTDQEQQDHRRLVRFWRRQQGQHEIICHFQAIPPTNKVNSPQEIIVSCIYWENKDDYFITSVDLIYLLEALIGVRFTTEEKNRVRRNLEGFRPLTVSKLKPESGDFFKRIMAFNHPKPRNIEKDLKVFAWSSLPTALKKIISKYSASYSSTASVTLDTYNV
ncbi:hypothetical protein BCR42DRAFT_403697 [Absidia repens]|uniref:DUF7082 domain-containing protein n=1 Tax=Absidia repens TaxID=90262 RepID=A0A1X2IV72_9FUNG|nr:hypothetical protein BCR42DRAFT_403697 [Absidia repens]